MTNIALNTLDSLFFTAEKVEEFDYVAFGHKVITLFATAAAIAIGVFSYATTAAQLFWEEHGETISVTFTRSIFLTVDFIGDLVVTGRDLGRGASHLLSRGADFAFYTAYGL